MTNGDTAGTETPQVVQPTDAPTATTSDDTAQNPDATRVFKVQQFPPDAPEAQPVNPSETDKGDYYLQQRLNRLQKDQSDADEAEARYKTRLQVMEDINKKYLQQKDPTPPTLQPYNPRPGTSQ